MKKTEKYTNPEITPQEMDELTGKLLRAKFDRDKKEKWADMLEKQHQIRRGEMRLHVAARNTQKWWLLVAASLLLPVAAYLLLWRQPDASALQLADAYLTEEKIPEPQTRKGEMEILMWSQKATEAYNDGKYQEAIKWWNELQAEKRRGMTPEDYFFLAVSHLRLNNPEAAIENFGHLRELGAETSKFQVEATWMLALAHLKAGHTAAATKELQQVVHDGWRAEKARKLLESLNATPE